MAHSGFKRGNSPTLSRLKASANFQPVHKRITLREHVLDVWVKPLTLAETDKARQQARRASKDGSDDSDWVLHLVALKLLDEKEMPLFSPEEIPELKKHYFEDVQLLMTAALGNTAPEIEEFAEGDSPLGDDPKESRKNSGEMQKPG